MSIREVFMVWGQTTGNRTRQALERADFEMRQRNMSDQARRAELMKMLKMEYDQMKALKSNIGKVRREYAKEFKGRGKGYQEFVALVKAKTELLNLEQKYDKEEVQGYRKLTGNIEKEYERTKAMTSALEGYANAVRSKITGASQNIKDKASLKRWLITTASQEYSKLSTAVAGRNNPREKYLLYDVSKAIADELGQSSAQSNWNKSTLTENDIANALSGIGVNARMEESEWQDAKDKEIEKKWGKDPSKKNLPASFDEDVRRVEKRIRIADGKVPSSARPLLKDYLKESGVEEKDISEAEERIKEIKGELKTASSTYDYGDVQRRAGEILLQQETIKKMRDLPADEVEYIQSLPDAFGYAEEESLKGHGPMGRYVDTVMASMKSPQDRKGWSELLAGVKSNAKGNEQNYLRGRSMMASRLLRAAKAAQGADKVKEKAISKAVKSFEFDPAWKKHKRRERPRDWFLTEEQEYGVSATEPAGMQEAIMFGEEYPTVGHPGYMHPLKGKK